MKNELIYSAAPEKYTTYFFIVGLGVFWGKACHRRRSGPTIITSGLRNDVDQSTGVVVALKGVTNINNTQGRGINKTIGQQNDYVKELMKW